MKNQPKVVNAWCMYDWANSVYSLVITSAIFPVYYQAVAKGADGSDIISFFGIQIVNSVLYSYALSFSFLVTALMLPILSGMADYSGKKKLFLKFFVILGSTACAGMFFFKSHNVEWGITCSVLASIGYSSGLVFYDAFLPEIVDEEYYDKTSAKGYSYGYVGSVILLLVSIAMIKNFDMLGFEDEGAATRFSFLMVGVWWFGFAQITFYMIPEGRSTKKHVNNLLTNGYLELKKVWLNIRQSPEVKKYLSAFFFYNMGVQTVMYLAATFGSKELDLDSSKLITTVLLIQLVAIVGASVFAKLSERKGNIFSLITMNFIWVCICVGAYFIAQEPNLEIKEIKFYILAAVVGLVMGGIQALSRATYAKLIPESTIDHASYFSFYDVTFNLSIVFGTFSYGLIEQLTGSMRNSTIALGLFFVLGIVFLSSVRINKLASDGSTA